jgi:hypothetical protein
MFTQTLNKQTQNNNKRKQTILNKLRKNRECKIKKSVTATGKI